MILHFCWWWFIGTTTFTFIKYAVIIFFNSFIWKKSYIYILIQYHANIYISYFFLTKIKLYNSSCLCGTKQYSTSMQHQYSNALVVHCFTGSGWNFAGFRKDHGFRSDDGAHFKHYQRFSLMKSMWNHNRFLGWFNTIEL